MGQHARKVAGGATQGYLDPTANGVEVGTIDQTLMVCLLEQLIYQRFGDNVRGTPCPQRSRHHIGLISVEQAQQTAGDRQVKHAIDVDHAARVPLGDNAVRIGSAQGSVTDILTKLVDLADDGVRRLLKTSGVRRGRDDGGAERQKHTAGIRKQSHRLDMVSTRSNPAGGTRPHWQLLRTTLSCASMCGAMTSSPLFKSELSNRYSI